MTTIVGLVGNDFIVMGSDSLATYSHEVVRLDQLKSLLDSIGDIDESWDLANDIILDALPEITIDTPKAHMTQVEKLFRIGPDIQPFGVMLTGCMNLGDRTVHSLVSEFGSTQLLQLISSNWTIDSVSEHLHSFMRSHYEMSKETDVLNLMVCALEPDTGGNRKPALAHIEVQTKQISSAITKCTKPEVYWDGTFREVERLVEGVEHDLKERIVQEINDFPQVLLEQVNAHIKRNAPKTGPGSRPRPIQLTDLRDLEMPAIEDFPEYGSNQLQIDFDNISVQKAIDLVAFLLDVQIKCDEFSLRLPTVGGDIQLALINNEGFKWISKREWHLGSEVVERYN